MWCFCTTLLSYAIVRCIRDLYLFLFCSCYARLFPSVLCWLLCQVRYLEGELCLAGKITLRQVLNVLAEQNMQYVGNINKFYTIVFSKSNFHSSSLSSDQIYRNTQKRKIILSVWICDTFFKVINYKHYENFIW